MPGVVLAFLLGAVWVQQLAHLPSWLQCAVLLVFACGLAYRRLWPGFALLAGVLWASVVASSHLQAQLPEARQARNLSVEGYVAGIPKLQDGRLAFDFILTNAPPDIPEKIRLNWYRAPQAIRAGQGWRLVVRLKQPHGRLNPGGFDYEAWLFANSIGATGYVRDDSVPQTIDPGFHWLRTLAMARQAVADRLGSLLADRTQAGLVKALTLGDQNSISQAQWQIFRATGVVHLVVISGSHISLIAGLVFMLARKAWARFGSLWISPQNVAACCAWFAAWIYSGLAGFSIPVQRALVMLSVALFAVVAQRNVSALHILLLALLAVLLFDPLAVVSVGFWLSFAAVALLLYISTGRMGRPGFWREAMQAQWVTALGLAPLLVALFQQVSLVAPLANWLAVPLVGVLVVPLCLGGLLLSWLSWPAAVWLFAGVDWLLNLCCRGLEWLAAWPLATVALPQASWYALMMATAGAMVMLAPRGWPARYLGLLLWLPLLFPRLDRPLPGELRLTLLDVGQGLSAVVQTAEHVLVFDTGARYSDQSDMGEAVLLPFLHYHGVDSVDTLIVSHGDIDHSGGAPALLEQMPVAAIASSVAEFAERENGLYCRAGQRWQWDGVAFEILSPHEERFVGDNDNSCVLKISTARQAFLLTGDIEQVAEDALVERYGNALASTVLVAPHHGSKTSSSRRFLQEVAPQWVLIPAGHMNRFGFPHASVLARYRSLGISWQITGEQGAIDVKTDSENLQWTFERKRRARYWMRD